MILNEKIEIKQKYCPQCLNDSVDVGYDLKTLETDNEKEPQIEYYHPIIKCLDCGVSSAFEGENAKHDALCYANTRVTPQKLVDLRNRYNMTQAEFADLIKVGEKTITRWENRSHYPNESIMLLVLAVDQIGPDFVYGLLGKEQSASQGLASKADQFTTDFFTELSNCNRHSDEEIDQKQKEFMSAW